LKGGEEKPRGKGKGMDSCIVPRTLPNPLEDDDDVWVERAQEGGVGRLAGRRSWGLGVSE
jgi:hypothetical protein